jgi:hypothetical protein
MAPSQRRVLVIGGSFSGLCVARDMSTHFLVTIVDAKEFFEYTPGVLRAYVKPKHFDALSFNLHPVIESKMGCKFIWGEVLALNGEDRTAEIKPMFTDKKEIIDFDYCIICCGCNFNPKAESMWFPTVHEVTRQVSEWKQFDERYIEGRRRHIWSEWQSIKKDEDKKSQYLVIGAGFIGVEWVTELEHFFPNLELGICDFLKQCLGPLPQYAKNYCEKYMTYKKIKQVYGEKYEATDAFYQKFNFTKGGKPDREFSCIGVKASNYFMPEETLSTVGPGGGGWILMDLTLAVKKRHQHWERSEKWSKDHKGYSRVYAVGDCNFGCVEATWPDRGPKPVKNDNESEEVFKSGRLKEWETKAPKPADWPIPPIAKISYPGEEEAIIALKNVEKTDHLVYGSKTTDCFGGKLEISDMHWPWGAGMFATSLGPDKACFVMGANFIPNSGYTCVYGSICAVQKEFIEQSKTNECRMGICGRLIWHFVHHTPIHLWGGGPRFGY